ncbi:hypothetical protein [Accumulibacter sp.]|jgi:hypothetical protein|uniref:hypothetical protein n=1 Tax=Accumulibacter sp. TaxID=2053492 RepID=UPI0026259C9C|nr:hypothetical protein [Accumulibacter sp.]
MNTLPKLELPKRWEFLEQRAAAVGLEPSQFVERVDDAASHIDYLLQRVRNGGGGLFEVFYGLSGSGKTTFLKTLPRIFQQIRLLSFPKTEPLANLPGYILASHAPNETGSRVVLIERRDNPTQVDMESLSEMFAELLETFRDPRGAALVLWPVTREQSAKQIAQGAWETGRDSMVDTQSKGVFVFKGLPREKFFAVADNTTKNLTGDGLGAFGISSEVANEFLRGTETIADFFSAVDLHAESQREKTWSVLKTHVRARLWVVLPGDLPSAIRSTVSSLTQGSKNKVDLDLIAEFIDQPENKTLYVADWRTRRAAMAHLLRTIDLRLFPLPPNVSLAAIRVFSGEKTRSCLKQATSRLEDAKAAMRASRLYKAILSEVGVETTPYAGSNRDVEETANEYRRAQATSSKGDKQLNKALGLLLEECLAEDAPQVKIASEKQNLPNCELKPDVNIRLDVNDYICLEPTWRSTEKGIPGELNGGQNTLAEAHMKKYLLEKATQYVKALDL